MLRCARRTVQRQAVGQRHSHGTDDLQLAAAVERETLQIIDGGLGRTRPPLNVKPLLLLRERRRCRAASATWPTPLLDSRLRSVACPRWPGELSATSRAGRMRRTYRRQSRGIGARAQVAQRATVTENDGGAGVRSAAGTDDGAAKVGDPLSISFGVPGTSRSPVIVAPLLSVTFSPLICWIEPITSDPALSVVACCTNAVPTWACAAMAVPSERKTTPAKNLAKEKALRLRTGFVRADAFMLVKLEHLM